MSFNPLDRRMRALTAAEEAAQRRPGEPTIPGDPVMPTFDWRDIATATDHDRRATEHKPTDQKAVLREVFRLRAQGLMPRDIATALGLNDHDVTGMLFGPDEPGTV